MNTVNQKINAYAEIKKQWVTFGSRKYYLKSKWEINYAHYLEFMKSKGFISEWFYEADEFWFLKIMRGVRSYKPDFKVVFPGGQVEYHEVKGYLDSKSRTKIKRMKKYYPDVVLIVINKEKYSAVAKWRAVIPNWIK